MTYNWYAILGGLVGGVLAALVAGFATTGMLPAEMDTGLADMIWAALVAVVGGVLGVVAGWFVNRRRGRGLGGIVAIVAVLGSVVGTYAWFREYGEVYDLFGLLVRAILMLGGGLIMLAAACGLTAALLKVQSLPDEA